MSATTIDLQPGDKFFCANYFGEIVCVIKKIQRNPNGTQTVTYLQYTHSTAFGYQKPKRMSKSYDNFLKMVKGQRLSRRPPPEATLSDLATRALVTVYPPDQTAEVEGGVLFRKKHYDDWGVF